MTLGFRRNEFTAAQLSTAHRAAVLVMYLDTPIAKDFLKQLTEEEIEEIRDCMDDVIDLEPSLIAQVVADFMREHSRMQAASVERAQHVEEKQERPLTSPTSSSRSVTPPQLKFLEHYNTQQIRVAFAELTKQQAAVALLSMDVDFAASILAEMPEPEQQQICMRMARVSQIHTTAIAEIAETLENILKNPHIQETPKPVRPVEEGLSALVNARSKATHGNAQSRVIKKSAPPTTAVPSRGSIAARSASKTSETRTLLPSLAADPPSARAYAQWQASLHSTKGVQDLAPTYASPPKHTVQLSIPDPEALLREIEMEFASHESESRSSFFGDNRREATNKANASFASVFSTVTPSPAQDSLVEEIQALAHSLEEDKRPVSAPSLEEPWEDCGSEEFPAFRLQESEATQASEAPDSQVPPPLPPETGLTIEKLELDSSMSETGTLPERTEAEPLAEPPTSTDKYAIGSLSMEPPVNPEEIVVQSWPDPPASLAVPRMHTENRASRRKKGPPTATQRARGPTSKGRSAPSANSPPRSAIPSMFSIPLGGLLALRSG